MPDQQVSAWTQAAMELFNQPLLLGLVEIHHHIAAEDDVVSLGDEFCFEIVKVEVDNLFDTFLDRVPFANLVEVAEAIAVIH